MQVRAGHTFWGFAGHPFFRFCPMLIKIGLQSNERGAPTQDFSSINEDQLSLLNH